MTTSPILKNLRYEVVAEVLNRENAISAAYEFAQSTAETRIDNFHGTFLSNFYAVPVLFNETQYPSVEHAYQAAKFYKPALVSLDSIQRLRLDEFLKAKGYARPVIDYTKVFRDTTMMAGSIKGIADILRSFGLQRADWDAQRAPVMADLLCQKYFSNPFFADKLLETRDRRLFEGNTWGDTYWGMVSGKGRNMLGRMLEVIREKLRENGTHVNFTPLTN